MEERFENDDHVSYAGADYHGRKVFRRTDGEIREEVLEALRHHPDVDEVQVTVSVLNGVVHLRGTIPAAPAKVLVDRTIGELPGVVGVLNDLSVSGEVR